MIKPLPEPSRPQPKEPANGWRAWVKVLGTGLGITVLAATATLAVIGLVIFAFVFFLSFSGASLGSNK
jgi:hypothetical protein